MSPLPETDPVRSEPSLGMRICILIGGCNLALARRCLPEDAAFFTTIALLFVGSFTFQATVFTTVGHVLFAHDNQVHPLIIVAGIGLAFIIYTMDAPAFLVAGHYLQGVKSLMGGGIDISGGFLAKLRAGVYLAFRIALSIALSLLTGIWVGMLVFGDDISSVLDAQWRAQNLSLIQAANVRVDVRIGSATNAYQGSMTHLSALQHQLDAAQAGIVDPTSGIGVSAEQAEFQQLLKEQSESVEELRDAQKRATSELGGDKGAGLSGTPGEGPKYRAAIQRLKDAQASNDAVAKAIDAARAQLATLRSQVSSGASARAGSAKAMLPALQSEIKAETTEVESQRETLSDLTDHRDQAVQKEVENAPEYVAPNYGMIARLTTLKDIAHKDHEIAAVILLIDLASMGLELGSVIVKVTTFIPSRYCPLLASTTYLNTLSIVDELDAALRRKPSAQDSNEEPAPDPLPPISPAVRGGQGTAPEEAPTSEIFPLGSVSFGGSGPVNGAAPRPRGRPRKDPTFN